MVPNKTILVASYHAHTRWRLVPVLVKREDALKAFQGGKTICRNGVSFAGDSPLWSLSNMVTLVEAMFDDSACWEIRP